MSKGNTFVDDLLKLTLQYSLAGRRDQYSGGFKSKEH